MPTVQLEDNERTFAHNEAPSQLSVLGEEFIKRWCAASMARSPLMSLRTC